VQYLQPHEAHEQQPEGDQHREARDAEAQLEVLQLAVGVADLGDSHRARGSSIEGGRRWGSSSSQTTAGHSSAANAGPANRVQPG
jgi:hypothetical protein